MNNPASVATVRIHPAKRSRRFAWMAKCCLACLSGLIAVKLGDMLFGSVYQVRQRHLLRLMPDSEFRHHSSEFDYVFRTNALGFRGPDLPFQKPDGARRIIVVGDSFVAGNGVADDHVFTTRLAELFQDSSRAVNRQSVNPIEVVNLGRAGTSTVRELDLYESFGRRFHPDVVILAYFLGNDLAEIMHEHTRSELESFHPQGVLRRATYALAPNCYLHLAMWRLSTRAKQEISATSEQQQETDVRIEAAAQGRSPEDAVKRYRALPEAIRKCVAAGDLSERRIIDACVDPESLVLALDPADAEFHPAWSRTEDHLQFLQRAVTQDGARLVMVAIPAPFQIERRSLEFHRDLGYAVRDEWLHSEPRVARALGDWAERNGVPCLNLTDDLRRSNGPLYFVEDSHFTPAGHERAAQLIASFLEREGLCE